MPVLTGEVPPSPRSRRFPLAGPRRRLAAIGAAGLTGAVLITGAVTGASAAPTAAPVHVITLASASSSAAGHLILRLRYEVEPKGGIKALSISYSGGTVLKLRRPVLIVSLRPVGFPFGQVHVKNVRLHAITFFLRLRNTRAFAGSLPLRLFGRVNWTSLRRHLPPPGGQLLEATVASAPHRNRHQLGISLPVGLQVGILIGPALP